MRGWYSIRGVAKIQTKDCAENRQTSWGDLSGGLCNGGGA